jgi:hypothetical protein
LFPRLHFQPGNWLPKIRVVGKLRKSALLETTFPLSGTPVAVGGAQRFPAIIVIASLLLVFLGWSMH